MKPRQPLRLREWLAETFDADYEAVLRLAHLLSRDPSRADDLAQEAFSRLAGLAERPRPGSERAYLRTTVVNLVRAGFRHDQVASRHQPKLVEDPAPAAEHVALTAAVRTAVLEAVDGLSDRQRECVILHYFEDLTDVEIGTALGISAGSVKTHLHRARTTLNDQLEGHR